MLRRIHLRSHSEIAKIQKAGLILAEIFEDMRHFIRPGLSTLEINDRCERIIRSHGGSCPCINYGDPPYPAATCISLNETIVHGIPRANCILHEGDIVTVDVVAELDGYLADACRTYAVGQISAEAKLLIEDTEASFWQGLEQAKVGARVGDISSAIGNFAEGKGYGVIREMCGHGIGTSMHEAPDVPNYGKAGHGPRLAEGMVFCIEPMIALGSRQIVLQEDGWGCDMADGQYSAHYENTVLITEQGPSILTMTASEIEAYRERYPFLAPPFIA